MKPTTENFHVLMWDARRTSAKAGGAAELTPNDPVALISDAADIVLNLQILLGWTGIPWAQVRVMALRLLHLAALIAWHAGTRAIGLRSDPPTSAETPEAKSNVDALLKEADELERIDLGGWALTRDLAAALRSELARADGLEALLRGQPTHTAHNAAVGHLRAVIAWQWPDGMTKPRPVREAEAFLASEKPPRDVMSEIADALETALDRERDAHATTKAERDAVQVALGRTASELGQAREDLRKAQAAPNVAESLHAEALANSRAAHAALLDERGVSAGLREKLAAAREDVRIVEEAAVRLARATSKGVA